jgi:hypothetical protein
VTDISISKRGQIFQISQVDASISPPLFSLVDLMKDKVPGHFYSEQLTKAPKPNYKKDFFLVERVLSEKIVKRQKYFLVKFLYYPNKFNQYVLAENIKKS